MAASPLPPDLFDEAGYLRLYPDIAQAVAAGSVPSGRDHYRSHGQHEGRRPNDVDPDYYLRAYPQAAAEIAAGRAVGAAMHYLRFGRARGYRPNAALPAPAATAMPPVFPWLWTDLPHAADLIDGRLALGSLSERQAALLHGWVRDGFIVLADPFDPHALAAAALDLERAFAGACPDLLFSCGAVALEPVHWQPEINPYPAAALDLHFMSRAVRELLFAEPLAEMLGLLFDSPALLAHSRGTLREAAQTLQRDGAGVGYSLPRQWVTAFVMLDEATGAADAPACFPGSHRIPPAQGRKPEQLLAEHDIAPQTLSWTRGQVVLRHPALLHSAGSAPDGVTRRCILAQYCPAYVAPHYAERIPVTLWPHGRQLFASPHYPGIDPLD